MSAAAGKDRTVDKIGETAEANAEGSEGSGDSSSECSEEIVVYETPENQTYERRVVIGLLSRVSFREQFWTNKVASYFVILSFLLTVDNVMYFNIFTHTFGMCWALVYVICMLIVGFPLAYLEMALGQYTSTGILLVFDRMTPGFVGVGISALLFNFILAAFDHSLFVDMTSVATEALIIINNEMPWHRCLSELDTKACHTWGRDCSNIKSTDIPEFPSKLAFNAGKEFAFVQKGDSCIRAMTRGIHNGVADTRGQLVTMTVAIIGYFDCMFLTVMVTFVTYFYSLFHIFTIDSYKQQIRMLYPALSRELGQSVAVMGILELLQEDPQRRIRELAEQLECSHTTIVASPAWPWEEIVRFEILAAAVVEANPAFTDWITRFVVVVLIVLLNTLLELGFTYKHGYIRLATLSLVVFPLVGAVIVFCEVVVVGLFYGFRVFFSNTSLMAYGMQKSESKKLKLILNSFALADWALVLPVACIFMLVTTMHYDIKGGKERGVELMDFFNWMWTAIFLLPIPGLLIFAVLYQYSIGNNIYPLFKRNPDLWGPRSRSNRNEAERAERMIRKWW
ncbi:unnamed protein product [Heligmosomoides polygyrus]|uniref:Lipase_3 domain-containing protein n=1 Tax=Heligmosomoides polygyrus TaxID=6339 RepID=A0A3P8BPS1_HELPZ|nr:unnamed protein product [Heligmosomoides polygyrus]